MDKRDKAADRRLLRTYGIALAEYNMMFEQQGGVCKICKKPPKEDRRLHVDHDHASHKIKIKTECIGVKDWKAYASYGNKSYVTFGKSSRQVKQSVLMMIRRKSVRGLLCWFCNSALQGFRDDPELMESAAQYIRDYKKEV